MKKSMITILTFSLFGLATNAFAENSIKVSSLDGSAKVQHAGKKDWDNLSAGAPVLDNDMIETYFQTRLVMQLGKGNSAILGPNTKALVGVRMPLQQNGETVLNISLTLFSGGCFIKAVSKCHVSIFTSNAIGETDSGSLSATLDLKTGETSFEALDGSAKTRAISQEKSMALLPGQTTAISSGKEPTRPQQITAGHVSALKRLFGESPIDSGLSAAGVRPGAEQAPGPSVVSPGMGPQQAPTDQTRYKPQFSENKIWGAILDDQEKNGIHYSSFAKPDVYDERWFTVEESNEAAFAAGHTFPRFMLTPSFSSQYFGAGLRVPVAANHTGKIGMYNFSSASGVLDLIDHVTLGPVGDSTYLSLGPIHDYTVGNGTVVDHFSNGNPYSLFHPLGLFLQARLGDWCLQGFSADVSSFTMDGIYLSYDPNIYHFGAGFFVDANQYYQGGADSTGYRFVTLPKSDSATVLLDAVNYARVYQLDYGIDLVTEYDFRLNLAAEFAQKVVQVHNDGYIFKGPIASLTWKNILVKADFIAEAGRLVAGQYNDVYMSNRARVDTAGGHDTLITQNTLLSPRRRSGKIELFFGLSPHKGISLDAWYKQNVYGKYLLAADTNYTSADLDAGISLSVNDGLWSPIKYGSVYFRQTHGGLYPPRGLFPSWGTRAGFDVVTNPILFGVGFAAGASLYYLDLNFNNAVDPSDDVMECYLAVRYGF